MSAWATPPSEHQSHRRLHEGEDPEADQGEHDREANGSPPWDVCSSLTSPMRISASAAIRARPGCRHEEGRVQHEERADEEDRTGPGTEDRLVHRRECPNELVPARVEADAARGPPRRAGRTPPSRRCRTAADSHASSRMTRSQPRARSAPIRGCRRSSTGEPRVALLEAPVGIGHELGGADTDHPERRERGRHRTNALARLGERADEARSELCCRGPPTRGHAASSTTVTTVRRVKPPTAARRHELDQPIASRRRASTQVTAVIEGRPEKRVRRAGVRRQRRAWATSRSGAMSPHRAREPGRSRAGWPVPRAPPAPRPESVSGTARASVLPTPPTIPPC